MTQITAITVTLSTVLLASESPTAASGKLLSRLSRRSSPPPTPTRRFRSTGPATP